MSDPRPCSPTEAIQRAQRILADPSNATHGYVYGGGDYRPTTLGGVLRDLPWTNVGADEGSDCDGFAMWCYKLPRHRAGFNRGFWATVSDDINPNSLIEDAQHGGELARRVYSPEPGDLLCYPTFYLDGHPMPWIGHVGIVLSTARAGSWNPAAPYYYLLDIAQCCGGPGRMPAVLATDGYVFDKHNATWPTPLKLRGMTDAEPKVSVTTVMLRLIP
jgi:hypothetical protein